jgi:hypothetical protein
MENEPSEKLTVTEFNALVERLIATHYDIKAGLSLEDAADITGLEVQEVRDMLKAIREEKAQAEQARSVKADTPPTFSNYTEANPKSPAAAPVVPPPKIKPEPIDFDLRASLAADFKPIDNATRPLIIGLVVIGLLFCFLMIVANLANPKPVPTYQYDGPVESYPSQSR